MHFWPNNLENIIAEICEQAGPPVEKINLNFLNIKNGVKTKLDKNQDHLPSPIFFKSISCSKSILMPRGKKKKKKK